MVSPRGDEGVSPTGAERGWPINLFSWSRTICPTWFLGGDKLMVDRASDIARNSQPNSLRLDSRAATHTRCAPLLWSLRVARCWHS